MTLYELERDADDAALLDYLRESDHSAIRARAATILGEIEIESNREPAVQSALAEVATTDPDPAVRTAAADSITQLGPSAIDHLIVRRFAEGEANPDEPSSDAYRRAIGADDSEIRMVALAGFAHRGEHSALPAVSQLLTDPDPRVRARAARACGKIAHPGAVGSLIEVLDDESVQVRREAAEALGQIGDPAGMEALLSMVEDPDEIVRYVAVSGLSGFASARSVDAITNALDDDSPAVRRAATLGLIEMLATAPPERSHAIRTTVVESARIIQDEYTIKPLNEIVRKGTRDSYRRNAAWLLGRIAGDRFEGRAIEALLDLLEAEDQRTVNLAVGSLLEMTPHAVETRTLRRIETDSVSGKAKEKAVFLLGKVGGDRARTLLESLHQASGDDELHQQITAALANLGGPGR